MCATDNTMRYSAGNLIANRYQITEILSQHSGGEVYLVFDMDQRGRSLFGF